MLLGILNNSSHTTKSNLLLHLQLSYYKVNLTEPFWLFFLLKWDIISLSLGCPITSIRLMLAVLAFLLLVHDPIHNIIPNLWNY